MQRFEDDGFKWFVVCFYIEEIMIKDIYFEFFIGENNGEQFFFNLSVFGFCWGQSL